MINIIKQWQYYQSLFFVYSRELEDSSNLRRAGVTFAEQLGSIGTYRKEQIDSSLRSFNTVGGAGQESTEKDVLW